MNSFVVVVVVAAAHNLLLVVERARCPFFPPLSNLIYTDAVGSAKKHCFLHVKGTEGEVVLGNEFMSTLLELPVGQV
jgi:hypothetical protein